MQMSTLIIRLFKRYEIFQMSRKITKYKNKVFEIFSIFFHLNLHRRSKMKWASLNSLIILHFSILFFVIDFFF